MANDNKITRAWTTVLSAVLAVGGLTLAAIYFSASFRFKHEELIGQLAPDIAYEIPGKGKSSIEKQKGITVLVNFWASWCTPCMEEMPSLQMLEQHFAKRNFVLLAFNLHESPEEIRGVIQNNKLPKNLIFNFSKAALRPYNVQGIPLSVLINSQGIIQAVYAGPRDWMTIASIKEIESALPPE